MKGRRSGGKAGARIGPLPKGFHRRCHIKKEKLHIKIDSSSPSKTGFKKCVEFIKN
jgi:hypothetical protein